MELTMENYKININPEKNLIDLRNQQNKNFTLLRFASLALIVTGIAIIIFTGGTWGPAGASLIIMGAFLLYRQIRSSEETASVMGIAADYLYKLNNLPNGN